MSTGWCCRQPWLLAFALCCSLLAGCGIGFGGGSGHRSGFGEAHDRLAASLPAEWRGRLPCVDCAGVDYRLLLRPDGTYFQRQSFPNGLASDDLGRWYVSSDGAVLLLEGYREPQDRFRIGGDRGLIKLGPTGKPLRGGRNFTLRRQPAAAWQPELPMRGRYIFANGRASFEECRSGLSMAVLDGAGAAAAERAYLDDRAGMGAPLLTTLRGSVRPVANSLAVDVRRFEATFPGLDCPPRAKPAPLTGTRWQLTGLLAQPVATVPGEAGPSVQLQPGGVMQGSSGCGEFEARYSLRGERIAIDRLAAPRESCPGDAVLLMMFTEALAKARSWRQIADELELYDAGGARLARFAAAP